jgi:hypothetical protein
MTYDEYIHSRKPVRVSAGLFVVVLLIPLATLTFEGWHSGVFWGFGFAVAVGFLIPGIHLLRPQALALWTMLSGGTSLFAILTALHYWRSVPDWMDAQIPHSVTSAISVSLFVIQTSMFILGVCGWIRYIRIRNASDANEMP